MLFLIWEKLLHWFDNILKVLEVTLFYLGSYCILAKIYIYEFEFFAYLTDEAVTRKNFMNCFEFKVGHI